MLAEDEQSFCSVVVQRIEIKLSNGCKLWSEQFSQGFNSFFTHIYFKLDLEIFPGKFIM